jgi:hypothetical protein
MDALNALFGNLIKVKILRLFLFNPETPFFLQEIVRRTMAPSPAVRRELSNLANAGFLRKKLATKDITSVSGEKTSTKKVHGGAYSLNSKFAYLEPLKNLLTISSITADESLSKRFAAVGRLKLFIASGVFIQNWDSRVDLLLVGDDLNLTKIESVIKNIEAEIGKEIGYSAFETADFEYRMGIHDRLIRDILDYPHTTLIDRLGIEPQ